MRVEYNENDSALSSGVETISLNPWVQHLLTLADLPNADQLLALDYELPVHRVFPCPECGVPVVLIQFAHNRERRTVNAIRNSDEWVADVVLGIHRCPAEDSERAH